MATQNDEKAETTNIKNMSIMLPNIAIVGNAPKDKCELLNNMLAEEELAELCNIVLYGADGQPEKEALIDALQDWRNGRLQGIVCLPFTGGVLNVLKECMGEEATQALPMYVNVNMKMASVMGDVEAAEAITNVTKETIVARIEQVTDAMKRDFFILNPRIAVAAINEVKAKAVEGDGKDVVTEAVEELSQKDITILGPVDTATFFKLENLGIYDALVEIYDAQCMENHVKTTDEDTLTIISGLRIPIVTGQYEATLRAIFMALDIVRNRNNYETPFANPLQKLYKERKEDGEKARFTVKKKGFNPAEHRRENVNYTTSATPKPSVQA